MGASRLGEDALYKLAFYITVQPKPTVIGRRSMHSRGKMFATDSIGATTAEKLDGTSRGAVDGDFLPFPYSLPSPLLLHPFFPYSSFLLSLKLARSGKHCKLPTVPSENQLQKLEGTKYT